jgi:uncharacterized membrane protein
MKRGIKMDLNKPHKSPQRNVSRRKKSKNSNGYTYPRISVYNLFWTLVFFSFAGYAAEMIFQFITLGTSESRQGLLYGPFSQIYGIGAVIAILISRIVNKKNTVLLFSIYAILGGFYEYLSSIFEEKVYGTTAWHYDESILNFQGRVDYNSAILWGVAGVVIVYYLYPFMCRLLKKIPRCRAATITWIVFLFIAANSFLTATALTRYSERHNNIPSNSKFDVFLDKKYPDSFMKAIYPDMKFK